MSDETPTVVTASPVLYKFTNEAESPQLDDILAMFYQGCYTNTIGIMQAFNLDTQETDLILVGVQLDENGKPDCFPLARALKAEDVTRFLAPDGKGGFYDPLNGPEAEEAKENMKSFAEAVVEPVEPTVN